MGDSIAQRMGGPARLLLERTLALVYPPQCLTCEAAVQTEGTLCPSCWPQTPFISGAVCDCCGLPLPGFGAEPDLRCDDCLSTPPLWQGGRAALVYGEHARRIVLGLKYHDRHEAARPAGKWLARAAAPLLRADTLVAPVPLHWWRLFRRRYNQSALLAAALSAETGLPHCPDLLRRLRPTGTQDGRSRSGRYANMAGAIAANPRRVARIEGRHVLLVDDVMTSGATLNVAAEACFAAGADAVSVVVLARVARDE